MVNITVVILTKNEEENIVDVIKNAQKLTNKVLIVDSGSTDKTVDLAEKNSAKVVYRVWDNDFSAQRNFALKHVENEWVMYLDADERMSDKLINNIKTAIEKERAIYKFERRNNAFGRSFKYGVLGPDSVTRLFPKDKGYWEGKVHEKIICNLPLKVLDGHIEHYTYKDFDEYLAKMNMYSEIGAVKNYEAGKKVKYIKDFIFRPFFAFVKMYILKKGFLEGWMGFILCLNYANYTLSKYVKLMLMDKKDYVMK